MMIKKGLVYCERCGEIIGFHKKYINTRLVCERCWFIWRRNLHSKHPEPFNEWIENRTKLIRHMWTK